MFVNQVLRDWMAMFLLFGLPGIKHALSITGAHHLSLQMPWPWHICHLQANQL